MNRRFLLNLMISLGMVAIEWIGYPFLADAEPAWELKVTHELARTLRGLNRTRHGRLRPGDVIVAVNGQPVTTQEELFRQLAAIEAQRATAILETERGRKRRIVPLVLLRLFPPAIPANNEETAQ